MSRAVAAQKAVQLSNWRGGEHGTASAAQGGGDSDVDVADRNVRRRAASYLIKTLEMHLAVQGGLEI